MPDPRWTGPPELIALLFEAGSPASVIANNAIWVGETVKNELSAGLSTSNSVATAEQWRGIGSVASTAVAVGLNLGLQTLVGWTAEKITITQAAVEAFSVARSAVIPSVLSQTNRDEWTALNATNFFGQNTPAIVERDTEYFGEHWPHNSGVGWTYSAALSALIAALAVPPPITPMGASPAAPAAAASAVTQAAAQTGMNDVVQLSSQTAGQTTSSPAEAAGQLSSLAQQPLQMMSSVSEPLKELGQAPAQAVQGVPSMPQSLMQSFGGMFPSALGQNAAQAVTGSVAAGGGGAGGVGAAPAGGGGVGGFPGAGLTSYTRPTSTFEPQPGGRPTGLRAGMLDAARNTPDLRSPTTSSPMGGTSMPMSPAGMLAHGSGTPDDKKATARARIVVNRDPSD